MRVVEEPSRNTLEMGNEVLVVNGDVDEHPQLVPELDLVDTRKFGQIEANFLATNRSAMKLVVPDLPAGVGIPVGDARIKEASTTKPQHLAHQG